MAKADLIQVGDILMQMKKAPEEVFDFFKPDDMDMDRASMRCWAPQDADKPVEEREAFRTTKLVSCSSGTLDRYERILREIQEYRTKVQAEDDLEAAAREKGDDHKRRTIPEPKCLSDKETEVAIARLVAESVESWDKAPRAACGVPDAGFVRGEDCKLPAEFLPSDLTDYSWKANALLVQVTDAFPARFTQRLMLCSVWVSNLDVRRFFPDAFAKEETEADGGKDSGESSATP